jgi:hypothetical protein
LFITQAAGVVLGVAKPCCQLPDPLLCVHKLQAAQAIDTLISDRPLAAAITAANAPFEHSIEPFTRR